MGSTGSDTDELLVRVAAGEAECSGRLLERYRPGLRRMVAVRMDPRLAARVDPSDVVQEAFAEAARKLPDYLRVRPVAFYPWLRRLAWEHLVRLHRRHLLARNRSVSREEHPLHDGSVAGLAEQLSAAGSNPSRRARLADLRGRVRAALDALPERDREVLVLRYLEGLSTAEAAAAMGVTEGAAKVRHLRAIERLRGLLGDDLAGEVGP